MLSRWITALAIVLMCTLTLAAEAGADDVMMSSPIDSATATAAHTTTPRAQPGPRARVEVARIERSGGIGVLAIAPNHRPTALGAIGLLLCAVAALDRRR
jgi:hypothetical protein